MYEIAFDAATRVLRLRISGFWERATALAFAAELKAVVDAHAAAGPFDCVSDAREFPPQSAAVAAEFGAMSAAASARRTAILVGSMIAKMQASRTMESEKVRIFLDEAAAARWLTEG